MVDNRDLVRLKSGSPVAWKRENLPRDPENEGYVRVGTDLEGNMKPIDSIIPITQLPEKLYEVCWRSSELLLLEGDLFFLYGGHLDEPVRLEKPQSLLRLD